MSSNRGTKSVFAILFVIVAVLLIWGFRAGGNGQGKERRGNDAPAGAANGVAAANGLPIVTVSPKAQAQSGILVKLLAVTRYRTAAIAYGTVMDMQPLIDFRTRYATALTDAQTVRAAAIASKAEYERNHFLYADNQNISLKALQAAQAAYAADQAKVESAVLNANDIQASARQQFGEPLADWAFAPDSKQFRALLTRKKVLLRVTLPLDENLVAAATIHLSAYNKQRFPASLLSPSPQSDPLLQGRSFFYCTDTLLPVGTRIVAYLPMSDQGMQGIFMPSSAIVWFGGQPWVYVQLDKDHFSRRTVSQQSPSDGGFFVTQGFKPGVAVVVKGAQLLLSEEFRAQIKTGEEGGDDDD
ncbi:MAG: efflux RND transporter periplasmic adaptor subunit [Sulfuriferula sp.]